MPGSLSGNWNGVFSSDGITAAAHFPAIVRENLVGIYLWGSSKTLLVIIFEWPTIIGQKSVGIEETRLSVTLCG